MYTILLFFKYDTVQFAQIFQFAAQPAIRNVHKILVVLFSYFTASLECFIIADYKSSYVIGNAVIYDFACNFAHVIIDLVVTVTSNRFLPVCGLFAKMLFIFYGLQTCIFFIEPLVDGF